MTNRWIPGVCWLLLAPAIQAAPAILDAAKKGDTAELRALIRQEVDVNAAGPDGSTALMWAAYREDAEALKLLLAAQADVNARNAYGITPLLQASRVGNAEMVEALLKAGADLKAAERKGETPLMAAAAAGDANSVRLLISHGSDANAREQDRGQTALMWAAARGHTAVVDALLAARADPNVVATESSLVNEERSGARVYVNYARGGLTALMFAAREGHIDVTKSLIAAGAKLDVRNPSGASPMLIAVINDWLDLAAVLLEAGADPNDGSLYEAVKVHNLRFGATASDASRPRPDNHNELTPVAFIGRLVAKGADPNRVPGHTLHSEGVGVPRPVTETAYASALQSQDVAVIRLLLAARAVEPGAVLPGPVPATPLMAISAVAGPQGTFGQGGAGAYRHFSERSAATAARLLVEAGADVNQATATGETAVHRAAQQGQLELLRFLAERGANLEARTTDGLTPLDFAMGKTPPPRPGPPEDAPRRPRPQPEAAALLRELLKLPEAAPAVARNSNASPSDPREP